MPNELTAHWRVEVKRPEDIEMNREAFLEAVDNVGAAILDAEIEFRLRCQELNLILLDTRKRWFEIRNEL